MVLCVKNVCGGRVLICLQALPEYSPIGTYEYYAKPTEWPVFEPITFHTRVSEMHFRGGGKLFSQECSLRLNHVSISLRVKTFMKSIKSCLFQILNYYGQE
jgi:hypothetical protein